MIEVPAEIAERLAAHAPVAIGVSGGKDSVAVALAVAEYLAATGHRGPKILIHADLGSVEWADSGPSCERLQEHLQGKYFVPRGPEPCPRNWSLHVTRRQAGGMMERWQSRWASSLRRYEALECVRMILPWSTPGMRFCTAELKRDPICSYLKKMFPGQPVISITGIRADESPNRAKMPVCKPNTRITPTAMDWNPIIRWDLAAVFAKIASAGLALHDAYRIWGSSRVSCRFCIMSAAPDLRAAYSDPAGRAVFGEMSELELVSGFAFQSGKWLSELSEDPAVAKRLVAAKNLALSRQTYEGALPKHMEFTKGWPHAMPTPHEADLLAGCRHIVGILYGINVRYTTGATVLARYAELMELKSKKDAIKAKKELRKCQTLK